MNEFLLSIVLGIVEGLTEFLPVSSTAHLRIAEGVLGVDLKSDYWKMYSVVIQLGAILSVVVYFRARIAALVRSFPRGRSGRHTMLTHPLSLTMLAFAVTALPSYLAEKRIGQNLESLPVMAWALVGGGVAMWLVDVLCRKHRTPDMEQMGVGQAVWIGLAQVVSAVLPGTSRSMATIAAGQVCGMSRSAALEFSFFLSIPTMFAATGYKLLKGLAGASAIAADPSAPAHPWAVLAVGFVVSFAVALAVVAWFMRWVRRRGFAPFAVYRIMLGAGMLAWLWMR